MEFLMTYGWAILVVLAAIAALAYFGVLSPEKFLPEKCLFETGFTCLSSKIEPAKSTIVFSNGIGKTIIVTSVAVGGCTAAFTTNMISGAEEKFEVTGCSNGDIREVYKGDVTIKYTEKSTNLTKTAYGDIATKIEE
jgi:hypothetical protein|tara:strand:- start:106 stop:516 length:411 start_codon:yes stop_codon:yes gene_type:complete